MQETAAELVASLVSALQTPDGLRTSLATKAESYDGPSTADRRRGSTDQTGAMMKSAIRSLIPVSVERRIERRREQRRLGRLPEARCDAGALLDARRSTCPLCLRSPGSKMNGATPSVRSALLHPGCHGGSEPRRSARALPPGPPLRSQARPRDRHAHRRPTATRAGGAPHIDAGGGTGPGTTQKVGLTTVDREAVNDPATTVAELRLERVSPSDGGGAGVWRTGRVRAPAVSPVSGWLW